MRLNIANYDIDKERLPRHIAIIMDGNGRWAKRRNLPRIEGHRQGVRRTRQLVETCGKLGVDYLTIFAFSIENWVRPEKEVKFLMNLFKEVIKDQVPDLVKNNVRIRFIGRFDRIPDDVMKSMRWAEEMTRDRSGLTLLVAISYGGRSEIIDAVKKIIKKGIPPHRIDEKTFCEFLYAPDVPSPDLLIRTSGECRVSNFLTYQTVYTELWITKTLWPDFTPALLLKAISDYEKRERRFGGV
ncbi:isoprenyl transferase [candidate division WOR-3 bacterium JGI_Cruoil_03_44_89]|uniref:Isoprenyl transferase n=1 Tax=candidate division WOR-3 bacterium JGI_Cruoil_03_44_89 TaxID=1973748 RepID=A0A235BV48_UNCW3|nr:MAG: isoprenyl transferase [candidate division WOR-3 bacterium JGI_Cruoil_03_44_89]